MIVLRWHWSAILFSLKKNEKLRNERAKILKKPPKQTETSKKRKEKIPVKESRNFENKNSRNSEKSREKRNGKRNVKKEMKTEMWNFPEKERKNVLKLKN